MTAFSDEAMIDPSGRVPVFVFPSEAEFVTGPAAKDEPHPDRKCFTLYNPFSYPIAYKVLCTAPHNYNVPEHDGTLREKCYKDIVIRCKHKLPVGTVDKLRFEIRRLNEKELHGCKDIRLRTVLEPTCSSTDSQGSFYGMQASTHKDRKAPPNVQIEQKRTGAQGAGGQQAQWLTVLAAVVCAAALLAPTIGDPSASSSVLPHWLHLTLQQKLVAAYILGIVTLLIVRPHN